MLYCRRDGLRIFNSYSWLDSEVVRPAVLQLRDAGLCMFLDINDMDQDLVEYLRELRGDPSSPQYGRAGAYSWEHLQLNSRERSDCR